MGKINTLGLSTNPLEAHTASVVYHDLVFEGEHSFEGSIGWATDKMVQLDHEKLGLGVKVFEGRFSAMTMAVYAAERAAVMVTFQNRPNSIHFSAAIAAETQDRAAEIETLLREAVIEIQPNTDDGTVPVKFWTYTPDGPNAYVRRIDAHVWENIEANYPGGVRDEIGVLVNGSFRPAFGGQLILWHGPPGTGKTHALRALAWEWREWADLHYVVDPENMFGKHSDYLVEVLLNQDAHVSHNVFDPDDLEEQPESAKPRWKVLILEDSGEMLSADAKDRIGQALSRLLNTVDGFIGQGMRVLVLITTNEEIGTLHPAVARPGRCAARTLFKEFTMDEAKEWVENHDGDPDEITSSKTLADLFALNEGYSNEPQLSLVGFAS